MQRDLGASGASTSPLKTQRKTSLKLLDELEDLPMDGTIDPARAKAVAAENAARKALRALGERTEGEVRGILSALEAQSPESESRVPPRIHVKMSMSL